MAVKEITFMKTYRMNELRGLAYFVGLKNAIGFMEWATAQEVETAQHVMKWCEYEDIQFHEDGSIVGHE